MADICRENGNLQNPLGHVTSYILDGCLLQAVVNPLNQRTTYTYNRWEKVETDW